MRTNGCGRRRCALGEIRDENAVESLLTALADGSAQVRETAAWSLGEIPQRVE